MTIEGKFLERPEGAEIGSENTISYGILSHTEGSVLLSDVALYMMDGNRVEDGFSGGMVIAEVPLESEAKIEAIDTSYASSSMNEDGRSLTARIEPGTSIQIKVTQDEEVLVYAQLTHKEE